jgi:hypothetical protein
MQGEGSGPGGKYHNLFEYYSEKDTVPHEKNVSRGLAILLESEPQLLDRFIELINDKLPKDATPLLKPVAPEVREISFLQDVSGFTAPGENTLPRIVGVTLTPYGSPGSEPGGAPKDSSVVDIAVQFEDDLLLVEVKTAPARTRMAELARNVRAALGKGGEPPIVIGINWEEMMDVLDDVCRLQWKKDRSVLEDYCEHLNSRYPALHSAELCRALYESPDIPKKIKTLADGCARLLAQKYGWDSASAERGEDTYYIIPLKNFGFAREVHLCAERNEQGEWDGRYRGGVKAVLWLCNNQEQGFYFFNDGRIRDDLSWTRKQELKVEDGTVKADIAPYVKFSHMSYVMQAYCCPCLVDTDRRAVREKFFKPLAKRWAREEWPELRRFLTEKHEGLLTGGEPEAFGAGFERFFERSKRTFTNVNFGYEVTLRFPVAPEKIDAGETAERVVNAIDALKAEIENPAKGE